MQITTNFIFTQKSYEELSDFDVFLHQCENFSIRKRTKEFNKRYFIKHSGRESSRNALHKSKDAPTWHVFFFFCRTPMKLITQDGNKNV